MYVSHLSLTNFRNYHQLELDVPSGLLIFSGGNAQGKSNLLEAVYLLSIAKAYRASSDREAICRTALEDPEHAQVLGIVQRERDRVRIMVDMRLGGPADENERPYLHKDIRVDGIHVSASDLVGVVNAVLFDAEDIQLVMGSPATRRRYMDILICQLDRVYLRSLQKYQKVVYQRNHLLRLIRERRSQFEELAFWDEALVQEGVYITLKRHQVVQELRHLVSNLHSELTESQEELTMDYVPGVPLEGLEREDIQRSFERAMEEGRGREVALGASQWGPHRDDLRLMVGGMEAASYASRGQARTLALTLKLAEGTLLERERGESPILLLDDVLSELDISRRRRLLEYVSRSQQAIVSTTDLDRIEKSFLVNATNFQVEKGNIKPI
ncbi:MAG: DNA replication/repair protein RecF [Chloroflexi bacterium]|nr:DNA replication/repair protein RecF [Chloroflexota bacterium]